MTQNEPVQVMTIIEAAKYLRVSRNHLLTAVHGRIKGIPPPQHVRLGRRILFRRNWLDEWMEVAARATEELQRKESELETRVPEGTPQPLAPPPGRHERKAR